MKKFILLAFSALLLLSCNKQEPQEPQKTYLLSLDKRLVVAENAGGEYKVAYYLTDDSGAQIDIPDPENVSVSSNVDWVHDFKCYSSYLSFTVEPNESKSSRYVTLTVHYGPSYLSLFVSQSGAGEDLDAISKMNFDITYQIDGPHVEMRVKPEFDYVRYYIAYSKKSEVDQYQDRIQAVIKANVEKYLSGEINALVNYGGYTFEDALDLYATPGERTVSMSLNGESDYVGWCCAISNEAKVISDVVMKEFRTGSIPPSDNKLEVSLLDINCDRVSYSVQTSNEDQWASLVLPASEIEGLSDEQLLELFNSSEDVTLYLHFEPWEGTVKGLEADRDYVILTFGYSWGFNTTSFIKTPIRTLSYESSPSLDFSLEVRKVTNFRASCHIVPQEKTLLYYVDLLFPGETPQQAQEDIDSQIDLMVESGYGSRLDILRQMGYRGEQLITKTDLRPESTYSFIVLPIDENSGEFSGSVVCSEPFTTPKAEVSSSYISFVKGETYEQDSYAMLPLSVEKHGDVQEYWYCIYEGDLSDTDKIPDSTIKDYLLEEDGIKNEPSHTIACEYNTTYTLVGVCYDSMDNWSPVSREVLKFTK